MVADLNAQKLDHVLVHRRRHEHRACAANSSSRAPKFDGLALGRPTSP